MTLEKLLKPILVQGYKSQFIAMKSLHPEFKQITEKTPREYRKRTE